MRTASVTVPAAPDTSPVNSGIIGQILTEHVLSANEARRHPLLKNQRTGKPLDISGFYRLVKRGVIGADGTRIRLEAAKVPSGTITSAERIQIFVARLNGINTNGSGQVHKSLKQRQRAIADAERELEGAGLL